MGKGGGGRTDCLNVLKFFIHFLHNISSTETALLTESVIPINLTVNQGDLITLFCLMQPEALLLMSPNITRIEGLQCRATKFILNTHWQDDISYHERLSRLNLLPLTYWYEVKDLIFHFKCRVGHYTLPLDDYIKPKGTASHSPQLWWRRTNSQVPHKDLSI